VFFPGSRYENAATYTARKPDGTSVTVIRLPVRPAAPTRGLHPRTDGERLDLLAARYLSDPTAFWRLCDAGDALSPDALAARDLVAIPPRER